MFGFVFLINTPWVPLMVGFGYMWHLDRWRNVEGHSEGIFLGRERRIDCVSKSEVWMSIVAPGLKSGEEVGERLLSCPEQRKLRERVEGRCRLNWSSLDFLSLLSFPHVSHIPIGPPIPNPSTFKISVITTTPPKLWSPSQVLILTPCYTWEELFFIYVCFVFNFTNCSLKKTMTIESLWQISLFYMIFT